MLSGLSLADREIPSPRWRFRSDDQRLSMEASVTISALEAHADALLQIVVRSEREVRARGILPALAESAAPSVLSFPVASRRASAIVADPIGPTYRAELHRIGRDIHDIGGVDAVDEAIISIAVMDSTHSDWRAVVLESVWSEIGREAA